MKALWGIVCVSLATALCAFILDSRRGEDRSWKTQLEEEREKIETLTEAIQAKDRTIQNLRAENDQLRSDAAEIHRLRGETQRLLQAERDLAEMRSTTTSPARVHNSTGAADSSAVRTPALELLTAKENATKDQIELLESTLNQLVESSGLTMEQFQEIQMKENINPQYAAVYSASRDLARQRRILDVIKLRMVQAQIDSELLNARGGMENAMP